MSTDLPREALRTIFASLSGLPASRVIWAGEPKGWAGRTDEGKSGHLVLDCIATRRVGVDEEIREYDVEVSPDVFRTRIKFFGQRVRTLNVRAENYESDTGYDLLERIRLSLGSDEVGAQLNAVNLSLNGDEDIRPIDASAGNRKVSFASFDVLLNHLVTRIVDVDPADGDTYIDAVEVTGEENMAVAGTWQIGPP